MTDSELLKAYLADRDVPCPKCGYCLRGLDTDCCPECGKAIHISIERSTWSQTKLWVLRFACIAIIFHAGFRLREAMLELEGNGWSLGSAPVGLVIRYWLNVGMETACAVVCLWVLLKTLVKSKDSRISRLDSSLIWFFAAVLGFAAMGAIDTFGRDIYEW